MQTTDTVLIKMGQYVEKWKTCNDSRHVFLSCYHMMSSNMSSALQNNEFHDTVWVNELLNRFADYYFESLLCYDCGERTPEVWLNAHRACQDNKVSKLQLLVLGVNAHINYDLVLALYDMLAPEWEDLSDAKRQERYEDHNHVNQVIAGTIDRVQDEILEPLSPSLEWIDTLFGRMDEFLISRLIASWREDVWENTQVLLQLELPDEREKFRQKIEREVLNISDTITLF